MTRRYTLRGKELESRNTPKGRDAPTAPCIFCGKKIKHFNDGGVGWMLGARVEGVPYTFLYCNQPACAEAELYGYVIWRCYCQSDYVENVGPRCHVCNARPVEIRCPRCHTLPEMGTIARITLIERYERVMDTNAGGLVLSEPFYNDADLPPWSRSFYRCLTQSNGRECGHEWPCPTPRKTKETPTP